MRLYDVGRCIAWIAAFAGHLPDLHLAELATDHPQRVEQRGPAATADVVDLAGTSPIDCSDRRFDNVVDIREIPALAPITEHDELARGQSGFDSAVERHVRALAGAVNAEVAKRQ